MFGSFQQTALRIEITASEQHLREAITQPAQLKQWLAPLQLAADPQAANSPTTELPPALTAGLTYISSLGPIAIRHQVDYINTNRLRLILSQGIDGFHEWMWGEGWVQSRLEGVSLLPINLTQTASLLRLKHYLQSMH